MGKDLADFKKGSSFPKSKFFLGLISGLTTSLVNSLLSLLCSNGLELCSTTIFGLVNLVPFEITSLAIELFSVSNSCPTEVLFKEITLPSSTNA